MSINGTESGISVLAAAAQTFGVTCFPTTDTAGAGGSITVTAYDPYGNVDTGYTGTVAISSSDLQALIHSGDAGEHTFSLTLDTAGTQSITASDTVTTSLANTESGINVRAATATTLTVVGYPPTATAGVADQITVTAYDAFGNVASGYTGAVAFSSSDGHGLLPVELQLYRQRRRDAYVFGDARDRRERSRSRRKTSPRRTLRARSRESP